LYLLTNDLAFEWAFHAYHRGCDRCGIPARRPAQAEKAHPHARQQSRRVWDRPLPRGRGTLRNRCGDPAYCRAHNFAEVLSFRQVDRATPAVAVAANDCPSGMCDALVAIECSRYAIAIATHPANRPGSPPARR